jgi:hypothetical protein
MNSSEKENLAKSDPKTKEKKGLNDAQHVSEELKKKHIQLRSELETANTRIMELEEKEKERETLHKDLVNANNRIKKLEEKEKELLTLRRDLKNAEANKSEIKEKEKELESSGYGKEAFRIDLYPYEGHYQGKVVHLLTGEKKAFKGVDHKAIADFIDEQLPQSAESSVAPVPIAPEPEKSPQETHIMAFKKASISKFTIVQEGTVQKNLSIPHDQVFQTALVIDPLESIVEDDLPCPYTISVYAKRIGGGYKQILGKTKGQITIAGELTANVHCASLRTGIYRFVAFGTIHIKKDTKESIVQFQKGSLFIVS